MATRYRTLCDECGFEGTYSSRPRADRAFRLHSCDRRREFAARAQRAAVRYADIDRTPKPCTHPRARHEHGTRAAYTLDRCRCVPCARARAADTDARTRAKIAGTWNGLIDARPAQEHVRKLREAGMGWKRVARAAGLSPSTLSKILYGTRDRGPAKHLRPATADALLSVPMPMRAPALLSARTPVTSHAARLRLQSLAAQGWSVQAVAREAGVDRQVLDRVMAGGTTSWATDRAVARVHLELSVRRPQAETRHMSASITRTRRAALARGWSAISPQDAARLDGETRSRRSALAPVDATGARRRLRALHCLGWTEHLLAEVSTRPWAELAPALSGTSVTAEVHEEIVRLFDALSMQIPEDSPDVASTRELARASRWAPPLAWDDDTIDNPRARPLGVGRERLESVA